MDLDLGDPEDERQVTGSAILRSVLLLVALMLVIVFALLIGMRLLL